MVQEAKRQQFSSWWWLDSPKNASQKRSTWLQSTLAELDEKTKAMLKLIEEDADSFAQRAEMYYKKRPQLINMVEDIYRSHRSLAERYDQFKSESGGRLLTPWASPLSVSRCRPEKLMSLSSMDKAYDSYSDTYELEESEAEVSDVEDPEPEAVVELDYKIETEEERNSCGNDEVKKLKEEIERLKEENRTQKEQLVQKDEDKREVIRQLSLAMDFLREENVKLRKRVVKDSPKKQKTLEFNKLEVLWRRLFNGSAES